MSTRRAFTLIELMVVMTILTMLASMTLFGLSKAQARAQSSKTKATIMKLHELMMRRWESYQTRRIPWDMTTYTPDKAAQVRLAAIRQLMRAELPERWSEVYSTSEPAATSPLVPLKAIDNSANTTAPFSPAIQLPRPALSAAYLNYYTTVTALKTGVATDRPSDNFADAECLYMIVTVGMTEEERGRDMFTESEVGDVDGDGAKEFIDAWGSPIRFVRWPVGFVDDPTYDAGATSAKKFGHLSDIMPPKLSNCWPDYTNRHDPFDPRQVDKFAFELYPLIVSAGPDHMLDIQLDSQGASRDDPYVDIRGTTTLSCPSINPLGSGTPPLLGMPWDLAFYRAGQVQNTDSDGMGDGALNHYDNIHNHHVDATIR